MSFLQPTYLWGFFLVALPLIIHLLNKGDVKTVKVGSIRYLQEEETKQTRQLKLNELWLLLLRMLLLIFLVFALAEPILESRKKSVSLTYIIEPSLLKDNQMQGLMNESVGVSFRLLATNFPEIDLDNLPKTKINYWQLARQLQELDSDSIVVFSKAMLRGVTGMRPQISKKIHWVVMNDGTVTDSLIGATKVSNGILLHNVLGDDTYTDIQNKFIQEEQVQYFSSDSIVRDVNGVSQKTPLWSRDTLRVGLYYETEFLREKDFFLAALKAVSSYSQQPLLVTEVQDFREDEFDLSVWLKTNPPQKLDGTQIRFQVDSLANNLIAETAQRNIFKLTERLTIENVLNGRLTERLLQIMSPHPQLQKALASLDVRTMAEQELIPSVVDMEPEFNIRKKSSVALWFWVAALLILVLERLLAKFRKQ